MKSVTVPPMRRNPSAWSRLGSIARWMLMLAIIWDQAGSPLHHHRHESGFDSHPSLAAHPASGDASGEAEDIDREAHFAHAVLAVRPQFKATARAPTDPVDLGVAALFAAAIEARAPTRSGVAYREEWPPGYSSHRSLPPTGRAPPLHV